MVKKLHGMLCLLLILLITVSAAADPLRDAVELLQGIRDDGLRLTVSARLDARQPYGAERLESLNALLKYLSVQVDLYGDGSRTVLLADGSPALTWIRRETDGKTEDWLDSDPENLYVGTENNDLLSLLASDPGGDLLPGGIKFDDIILMETVRDLILQLPEIWPDACKSEKIRTKIGDFGTAVEKVTYTVPNDAVTDGSYQTKLVELSPEGKLKNWLNGITFKGRQTLILYRNEASELIRFVYAGNIRYSDGKLHSLNLSWKQAATDGSVRDSILLKSPATNGNDRDTLTLERNMTAPQGNEHDSMSWNYTRVRGRNKEVPEGEVELGETAENNSRNFSGSILLTSRLNSTPKQGLILKPDLTVNGEEIRGTLGISLTTGENIPESAVLEVQTGKSGQEEKIPEGLHEIGIPETEEERNVLTETVVQKTAVRMILPLMRLPEEALDYFSRGLTEEQWRSVTETAGD